MEEATTQDVSTPTDDTTQVENQEVSNDTQEEATGLETDSGEESLEVGAQDGTDWAKAFKGKKAKVYGADKELDHLDSEEKVLKTIQKGLAADKAMQERAEMERSLFAMKKQMDELQGRYTNDMSPENMRRMVMENEALKEDILWEQIKDEATPEQVAAFEAKRKGREADDYKQKFEGLNNKIQTEQQRAIQNQHVQESVEKYGNMVTQGIQNHPQLKHIQTNPMVSSEYLYWLRAAESKGLSVTPERLANHTWNSILEKTILPLMENVPMEDLAEKLGGFGKKWDDFKKSKIVNPDKPTPTDGEGTQTKSVKGKSMDDIWDSFD